MAGRSDKNKSIISRFFKAVKAKRAMPGSGRKPALTEKQNARVVTKTQEMIKVADAECDVETGPGSDRRSQSATGYGCCGTTLCDSKKSAPRWPEDGSGCQCHPHFVPCTLPLLE